MCNPNAVCPYCGGQIQNPDIYRAIQKEKEIWNMPDSFIESPDSSTLDIGDFKIEYIYIKEEK